MKKIYLLVLFGLLAPSLASAVWWKPSTWVKTEIQYVEVEKIVEKPVEIIREVEIVDEDATQDPILQSKIDSLNKTNGSLNAKIAQLEAQLKATSDCPTAPAAPIVQNDSSSRINLIKAKLAELDLVKFNYDNLAYDDDMLDILNETTDLEGRPLFPHQAFNWSYTRGDQSDTELRSLPQRYNLWQVIDSYVGELKIELAKLGGSL